MWEPISKSNKQTEKKTCLPVSHSFHPPIIFPFAPTCQHFLPLLHVSQVSTTCLLLLNNTHTLQTSFPLICHPSPGPPPLWPAPPSPHTHSHTLCLPVSHSFHSCPHILGSPVLRSRISLWNLMHLFPSLPGKR